MLKIVVGGQYGSEGKGKVVCWLAGMTSSPVCVRTGGPNAGHTVWTRQFKHVSRTLPSGYMNPAASLVVGAGGSVDADLLMQEVSQLRQYHVDVDKRLFIDKRCVLVDSLMVNAEKTHRLNDRVGSTQTGTGEAVLARVARDPNNARFAKDDERLAGYVHQCCASLIARAIDTGRDVILEGTQGIGLSLYHGVQWPFCTSRDTSAMSICSEAGVMPPIDTEVWVVFRVYPIRVAGNSGPMHREITWDEVGKRAGWAVDPEQTSVTKRTRRVGEWDWDLAKYAVMINRPKYIALHGMDYIDGSNRGVTSKDGLSTDAREFIDAVQARLNVQVGLAFTGPMQSQMVDLR